MVAVIMADGFEDIEALCPFNLLKRAGIDVRFVGATGKTASGKSCGSVVNCAVTVKEMLDSGEIPEMVILPGGLPGANNLDGCPDMTRLLETVYSNGGYLAAICAAPMVLGKRGFLKGRRATCFPGFDKYLDGAEYVAPALKPDGTCPERVVRDGRIITGAGMGASFEFGLALVAALKGEDAAEKVAASVFAYLERNR